LYLNFIRPAFFQLKTKQVVMQRTNCREKNFQFPLSSRGWSN